MRVCALRAIVFAALLAMATSPSPAWADIIFDLKQTGPTIVSPVWPGPLSDATPHFSAQLTVTEEAHASGFFVYGFNNSSNASLNLNGLLAIIVELVNARVVGNTIRTGLQNYTSPIPVGENLNEGFILTYSLATGLTGLIDYDAGDFRYLIDLEGTTFNGRASGRAGACYSFASPCSFGGTITSSIAAPVTIPEPATLALYGAGLLVLGFVRQRKLNT